MDRAVERMLGKVDRIKSFTTRTKRNESDLLYYEFVTREEVERRKEMGVVVQLIEYAGNYYGTDRREIERVLKNRIGMLAVVEYGIKTFTDAGFTVKVVRIEPVGYTAREGRKEADAERAKIEIKIDKTIVNDFAPGGIEKATDELIDFLQNC